jgi:hypothetical protein
MTCSLANAEALNRPAVPAVMTAEMTAESANEKTVWVRRKS